jgi:SAM-dependent methyltransferase
VPGVRREMRLPAPLTRYGSVAGARILGPLAHNADLGRETRGRRPGVRLNQYLFERGRTAPWVWSYGVVTRHWAEMVAASGSGNEPVTYSSKDTAVVDFLDRFWSPEVAKTDSVLEVGCNAGPNLNGLMERGYRQLSGVEISQGALRELRRAFPALAETMTTLQGPAEVVVPGLPEHSSDVVFSMAVLIHVHPGAHALFAGMVRTARKYICVIEAENVTNPYVFARNYRRLFERLGCVQVKSVRITPEAFPELMPAYNGYTARLLRVPPRS